MSSTHLIPDTVGKVTIKTEIDFPIQLSVEENICTQERIVCVYCSAEHKYVSRTIKVNHQHPWDEVMELVRSMALAVKGELEWK